MTNSWSIHSSRKIEKYLLLCWEPTRTTETSSTLLDLLITSTPNPFISAKLIKAGISDHFPICGVLFTKSDQVNKPKHRINETRKVDLEANHETFLNELRSIPWNLMDLFQNPDDKLYVWEKLFTPVMNEHFPIKKKRIRRNSHPYHAKQTV